ncbi:Regulatory protein AfsR [bacterium HR10]|nr:Regulatory protein AfsR [bacterium HR10]
MKRKVWSFGMKMAIAFVAIAAGVAGVRPSPQQEELRDLVPTTPIERELKGGEVHAYRLALTAGQYVRVVVAQRGIDVVVRLFGPDGRQIVEMDSPTGTQGEESVAHVAEAAGTYRLEVAPLEKDAPPGRYEVRLEELRPATEQDRTRIAADRAFAEAVLLFAQQTADALRRAIGKYEEAARLYHALDDRRKEAESLHWAGFISALIGEPRKALEYYGQALPILRAIGDRQGEAATLTNIGVMYSALGEKQKALEYYGQALAIHRAVGDRQGEARTLTNIGGVYSALGEKQKALEYYGQALPIRRAVGDRQGEAVTLHNIGAVYSALGEKQKALEYFGQALAILRAVGDRQGEAATLTNIGQVYAELGEKQKALEYFGQALAIHRAVGDRQGEATTLTNIGQVYAELGEKQKALEYFGQALPIRRAVGDRRGEAVTLTNIGGVYSELGEKQKALEYYGQALPILRAVGDRNWEAAVLGNIGQVYSALGEKQKALEYYGQALPIRRAVGDRRGEAVTPNNIGRVYAALGEKQKALEYFGQALPILRAVGDRNWEAAVLGGIARIERDRGELAQARTRIEAALERIESLRAAAPGPELRATFLASKRGYYEFYIDLLVRLDEREPGRGHDRAAFEASERSRARSLLELLTEARMDVRQGIAPELRERERAVHARIAGIQSQLLRVMSRAKPNPAEVAALEEALKRADAEREQVELEIRRKHPRYAALQYPTPVGVAAVQEVLDEQTALLEYVLTRESALLFIVTRADFRVLRLGASPATIRERVEKLRAAIAEGPQWTAFSNYVLNARWLYQDLIQPVEKWLAGKRELIIVPDGVLHYLPFEVLLTKGELTVEPRELSYLVRDYAVRYVPSASVLVELSRPEAERSKPEKTLVAYADPVYGEPDEASAVGKALRSMWGELRRLPRLPYSRQEVERIARLYPDAEVALFLGADAREENVKSGEPARYRFVHFAAHGVLNEKQPQYSGIVLTTGATRSGSGAVRDPARREEATEDGLLQVYEIFNLKLAADVVVLSACETGLGREVRGEGMVGLTRAFLYAGAQAVVVSLWKVADPATAELMMRFYRQMKAGVGKAEALRRARLELFREGRYVHPFYWAPFVLMGGA